MSGKVNYVIFKLFEFEKVESKSRQVWKHILQSDFHTKPDGLCAGLKYIFSLCNGNWLTFSNLWGRVFCTATACRGGRQSNHSRGNPHVAGVAVIQVLFILNMKSCILHVESAARTGGGWAENPPHIAECAPVLNTSMVTINDISFRSLD